MFMYMFMQWWSQKNFMIVGKLFLKKYSFQSAISPPRGIWQANASEGSICNKNACVIRKAIMANYDEEGYLYVMSSSTYASPLLLQLPSYGLVAFL